MALATGVAPSDAVDATEWRSAIADSSFSPEVKAKCQLWHQRGADLLAQMDALLLRRRQGVEGNFERVEIYLAQARAILAALRCALDEVLEGVDPLGVSVAQAQAQLRPNAASEAIADLKDSEIAALRALKNSPPANVRIVCVCACSLLRLATVNLRRPQALSSSSGKSSIADMPLATWEEAQTMLASPSFRSALRGFDPHLLHSRDCCAVAAAVRAQLASLSSSSSMARRVMSRGSRGGTSSAAGVAAACLTMGQTVAQVTLLQAAVRSGGRSVGQLYLWVSRVLVEAENLREAEALERAQQQESSGLAEALAKAQKHLDEFEARCSRDRGVLGDRDLV